MVLLRFAPSPTGALHLGGLRTALYNHLYAKKFNGKWLLRIEDTDITRTVPGSVDGIRHALAWAGLHYDYGPDKGGPHAPYYQSERLDLYRAYASKLLDSHHAYRCFCHPDKLAFKREALARTGSNQTYDKTCLTLTDEEVARKVRARERFVVRLNDGRLPLSPHATDIIFGALKDSHASLPTDPILLKSDGFPTYHLASVVDDHEMGITHVVRGEEWLSSLSLHLDLYAILGLKPPEYAHLPLLLNQDGSKMSKRKGDVSVDDFIVRGWEPEALLNWLALAGWGAKRTIPAPSSPSPYPSPSTTPPHPTSTPPPDSTTLLTLPALIESFDLRHLTHRRMHLDPRKLEYLNKRHVRRALLSPAALDALVRRVGVCVREALPQCESAYTDPAYLRKVVRAIGDHERTINEIPQAAPYLFVAPDLASDGARALAADVPSKALYRRITEALHVRLSSPDLAGAWDDDDDEHDHTPPPAETDTSDSERSLLTQTICAEVEAMQITSGVYMGVLRHALTGMAVGAKMGIIIKLLGKERTLKRLKEGWEGFEKTR